MECPICSSTNTTSYTDGILRRFHLLKWECYDCVATWQSGWEIDLPLRIEERDYLEKQKQFWYLRYHNFLDVLDEKFPDIYTKLVETE